jgi:hypothetical protein
MDSKATRQSAEQKKAENVTAKQTEMSCDSNLAACWQPSGCAMKADVCMRGFRTICLKSLYAGLPHRGWRGSIQAEIARFLLLQTRLNAVEHHQMMRKHEEFAAGSQQVTDVRHDEGQLRLARVGEQLRDGAFRPVLRVVRRCRRCRRACHTSTRLNLRRNDVFEVRNGTNAIRQGAVVHGGDDDGACLRPQIRQYVGFQSSNQHVFLEQHVQFHQIRRALVFDLAAEPLFRLAVACAELVCRAEQRWTERVDLRP